MSFLHEELQSGIAAKLHHRLFDYFTGENWFSRTRSLVYPSREMRTRPLFDPRVRVGYGFPRGIARIYPRSRIKT